MVFRLLSICSKWKIDVFFFFFFLIDPILKHIRVYFVVHLES